MIPVQGQRLGALLALGLAACAGKPPKPDEPPIRSLKIEGTEQISAGAIEDRISPPDLRGGPLLPHPTSTRSPGRRTSGASSGTTRRRASTQARVVDEEVRKEGDGVALTVQVNEGKPTKISAIDIEGLDGLPPDFEERVRRSITVKVGEILKEEQWEGVKREVAGALRALGYAEAEGRGRGLRGDDGPDRTGPAPLPSRPSLQVRQHLRRHRAQALGAGPLHHRPGRGRDRKGAWYSDKAMAEAQRRVFQMGVFGAVKVTTGRPDRENAVIPVVVDVARPPSTPSATAAASGWTRPPGVPADRRVHRPELPR
jgi:translocation and assembly module TamA